MKIIFNGKETMLSSPTPEKNLILAKMLEDIGYYDKGLSKKYLCRPDTGIVVNYKSSSYNRTLFYTAGDRFFLSAKRASFEDFVLEILREEPEQVVIKLDRQRTAVVDKSGTVSIELGYDTDNPNFSFNDIYEISKAIEQVK